MNESFSIERGLYGTRLSLTGPWRPEIAEHMRREQITELYLNHARGWRGEDVQFLRELPGLLAFSILDFSIRDVSPIHHLQELRALEVSTYCNTPVKFQQFPKLEDCVFYWRPESESLFTRTLLRRLFLHRYSGSTSTPFAQLSLLEALSIANSDLQEIQSLSALKQLKFLGLYNLKKLTALNGVQELNQLEVLEVNGCKRIGRLDELEALAHLKRLQINDDGPIASLAPLRTASNLEELLFYESTNVVDGNLTYLTELPRLRRISFQNRRHYSHTRENLPLAGGTAAKESTG